MANQMTVELDLNTENKRYVLGQYFTRKEMIEKSLALLLKYKPYKTGIRILEPSFGSGNFIEVLKQNGFDNIEGCEIDPALTRKPMNFFKYPLENKFDLIIGNPPFTKYNIEESYYYTKDYFFNGVNPTSYLNEKFVKKGKMQIENAFILKSIKHLKNNQSSMAFVLPISFFIKDKNMDVKRAIAKRFSTIIIYQTDINFVDDPIPCCFAIFTNVNKFKDKIILLYENGTNVYEVLDKSELLEELIPKTFLYKKNNHQTGTPLSKFLSSEVVRYKMSFEKYNVSGANILERTIIPPNRIISNYCLAVARVGNSSVGRAGLINIHADVLNGLFYVFNFKDDYNDDSHLKEKLCELINQNQEYFKSITLRVGSKSIKKSEILGFKVKFVS